MFGLIPSVFIVSSMTLSLSAGPVDGKTLSTEVNEDQESKFGSLDSCAGQSLPVTNLFIKPAIFKVFAPPLTLTNYNANPDTVVITNDGEKVIARLNYRTNPAPTIKGGKLSGTYQLEEFHVYWGPSSSEGSRHAIEGVRQALEIQVVHRDTKYPTLQDAAKNQNGLAIFSFLFQASGVENTAKGFKKLVESLGPVTTPGPPLTLVAPNTLSIASLIPDWSKFVYNNFFRYFGSLTKTDCNAEVIWYVMQQISPVGEQQVEEFRKLLTAANAPIFDIPVTPAGTNINPVETSKMRSVDRLGLPQSLTYVGAWQMALFAAWRYFIDSF